MPRLPDAERASDLAAHNRGRKLIKVRRRLQLVAAATLICAAGIGAFLLIGRTWGERYQAPRHPDEAAIIDGPLAAYTAEENEAWRALLEVRQRDPRSSATADALTKVALAHGRAGRVRETLAVHTQLFAWDGGLGRDEIRRLDVADQLAQEFHRQGRMAAEEAIWQRAYEQRRQSFGRRDPSTIDALRHLLAAYCEAEKLIAAESLFAELEDATPRFTWFADAEKIADDRRTLLRQRFEVYQSLERPREQAAALTRLLALHESDEWPFGGSTAVDAAVMFHHLGQPAAAEQVLRRAVQGGSGEGAHLVQTIALAWITGRGDEVAATESDLFGRNPFRPADPRRARSTRASHVPAPLLYAETIQALCDLNEFYRKVDLPDAAMRVTAEVNLFAADAGSATSTHAPTLAALAAASRRIRDWETAERHYRSWLEALRQAPKRDDRSIEYAIVGLSTACLRQGRHDEAIALQREVIELSTKSRGENDWFVLRLIRRLAEFHVTTGDLETAEQMATVSLRRSVELRGEDCDITAHNREQLALIAWKRKNYAQAAELLVELVAVEKRRLGPEHPGTLYVERVLGEVRRDQGQFAVARTIHQRGLADLVRVHGTRHRDVSDAYRALARDHEAENEFTQAAALYVEATIKAPFAFAAWNNLAWFRATAPLAGARDGAAALAAAQMACDLSSWIEGVCVATLAAACAETGDFEQAVSYQQQAIALADLTANDRVDWDARLALYRERTPFRQHASGQLNATK